MQTTQATPRSRLIRFSAAALALGVAVVLAAPLATGAQVPARGQNIAPVYEGFWRNDDGSIDLWFGYYNRNWEEQIDVPVGPDNHMDPGGPDLGQPTHFFPRRSQFVFKVTVPADFRRQRDRLVADEQRGEREGVRHVAAGVHGRRDGHDGQLRRRRADRVPPGHDRQHGPGADARDALRR